MSDAKRLVASIVSFLRTQLEAGLENADAAESLEVGIQCLESAFDIKVKDMETSVDLLDLFEKHAAPIVLVTEDIKVESEALKNEGNSLMKSEKFSEALQKYTQAIQLNSKNAIFYCNRAAAFYYLNDNDASIKDCLMAISLNPQYGRAYGRLGLAYSKTEKHIEAKAAYQKALELEPENEAYKNNLQLAESCISQNTTGGNTETVNLGAFLQNPTLMNVATQMLSDPEMQNLMSGILGNMGGNQHVATPTNINALLQAGQQLAQHMQRANPELVEQLRNHMGGNAQQPPNPQQPPQPPQ